MTCMQRSLFSYRATEKKWLKEHCYAKVGKELQGDGAQREQRGCGFAEGQEKRKENFLHGQF